MRQEKLKNYNKS